MASGSSQFVGINFATPVFELDIRTNDANDGSIINLGNLNNGHFLRLFSGEQMNYPFPAIYWNYGDSLSFGTNLSGYTEIMKLRSDGTMYINSQNGISLNQGNLPLITRGYDPFTSGAYSGLGRWGLFMEPFYLTLGVPDIGGRGIRFVEYNENSTITDTMMTLKEGNLGIGMVDPEFRLDIEDTQAVARLISSNSSNGSVLELRSTKDFTLFGYRGAINFNDPAGTVPGQIAYSQDNIMTFKTNGSEHMKIMNDGNVGINITGIPQSKLDVYQENASGIGLKVTNLGSGGAIYVDQTGSFGDAGYFHIANSNNPSIALRASTSGKGDAISGFHSGTQGNVARLTRSGATNPDPILYISATAGSMQGMHIEFNNSSLSGEAIYVNHQGAGDGLYIDKSKGTAARFNINGIPSNANTALVAKITTGNGVVASIDHNDVNSNNHALTVSHSGNGNAILAQVPGASTAYAVYAIGDAYKTTGGNLWAIPSDMRLKKNIDPFQVGLNTILKINPVTFQYNGLFNTTEGEKSVGIIAQELVEVAPYMINNQPIKDESNGVTENILTYDGTALSYILVNAIKELNNKISSQEEIISTMEIAIKELQKEIIQLKND